MDYILGISAYDLSRLLQSQDLKYKAYLGWIIETYDNVTYAIGGLLGHLVEVWAYLPYIPQKHIFTVVDAQGNVEPKTRKMYFSHAPKGQYVHIGSKIIEREDFINKTITLAKPQYFVLADKNDGFKCTYSIIPKEPKKYTSALQTCKNGFCKFLSSMRPLIILMSTIVDQEDLDRRMRILSLDATFVVMNISLGVTLYAIETYAGLVYTEE